MFLTIEEILAHLGWQVDLDNFLALFGLLLARCAAAISLTPFLGGKMVPVQVKTGLAAVMASLLYPWGSAAGMADLNVVRFTALLVKESLIGAALGFAAQLVFIAVSMAGELIDTLRGMNQPLFTVPQLADRVSSLGLLKLQAALAIFFAINGHLIFLRALAASFQTFPLLEFPRFGPGPIELAGHAARLTGQTLVIALQLSAPTLIALLLVDVAFGVVNKVAPRIDVHDLSQPWKAIVGLILVMLTSFYFLQQIEGWFVSFLKMAESLLKSLG